MTSRFVILSVACVVLAGCRAEPVRPSLVFEGVITSRQPFVGGVQGGGVDTVPAMLVEAIPGSSPNESCTNSAAFSLRDVKLLVFANEAPARLEDLTVGARVRVLWDGSQLDSCPPKRRADAITILS